MYWNFQSPTYLLFFDRKAINNAAEGLLRSNFGCGSVGSSMRINAANEFFTQDRDEAAAGGSLSTNAFMLTIALAYYDVTWPNGSTGSYNIDPENIGGNSPLTGEDTCS